MNVAIVGCGSIAAVHAKSIHSLKRHRLVAFADIKLERAEQFASTYQGHSYVSYEEMLDQESIDILHICTPHALHVPMAVYALKHKVHVFMEKPPVISSEQWKQLKAVSSSNSLGFCFQNRYNPSVLQIKQLLDSNAAGKIIGARGMVTWNRTEEYYLESGWRGQLASEGGGVLINQAIHTMDLLAYFLGKPISVDAVMANHHLKGIIAVEDMMEAYIRFEGGQNACFYATTAYCEDAPPIIELVCENMKLRLEDPEVTCYFKDGRVEKLQLECSTRLGKSYWGNGHMDCIADFYDSIHKQRPFALGIRGLEDTIRLMLGTYESARTGREVQL